MSPARHASFENAVSRRSSRNASSSSTLVPRTQCYAARAGMPPAHPRRFRARAEPARAEHALDSVPSPVEILLAPPRWFRARSVTPLEQECLQLTHAGFAHAVVRRSSRNATSSPTRVPRTQCYAARAGMPPAHPRGFHARSVTPLEQECHQLTHAGFAHAVSRRSSRNASSSPTRVPRTQCYAARAGMPPAPPRWFRARSVTPLEQECHQLTHAGFASAKAARAVNRTPSRRESRPRPAAADRQGAIAMESSASTRRLRPSDPTPIRTPPSTRRRPASR